MIKPQPQQQQQQQQKQRAAVPPCDQTTAVALWSCESQTLAPTVLTLWGLGRGKEGTSLSSPSLSLSLSLPPSLSLSLPPSISLSVAVCCQWLVSGAVVLYILNQVMPSGAREDHGCSHTARQEIIPRPRWNKDAANEKGGGRVMGRDLDVGSAGSASMVVCSANRAAGGEGPALYPIGMEG